VYAVWPEEIRKWEDFRGMPFAILHGQHKDKAFHSPAFIHLVNFDGLAWLSKIIKNSPGKFPYDMLVVDEISYLKNTRTQRFKALTPMLDHFKRRIGLTGSPAPNSLLDIFGPQLVIDRGATFGKYITHFRTAFFFPTGYGGYTWMLQPGAEKKIHGLLANKVLRMAAKDYLELPELIMNKVYVTLPDAAMKLYKDLEKKLITDINEGTVTASTAAVAIGKCQQIANGAVYLDGPEKEISEIHEAKLEAVEELVNGLEGQPCLIAFHFQHDLKRLKRLFPDAAVIGSGVTGDELMDIVERWNTGQIPVLLAHPQSAGHGLNLQGAGNAVIWFSNTWSLEHHDQFIRRLWRQGQRNNIIVHNIIAKKTIDEAIVKAVESKDNTQQSLMTAIRDYASTNKE